MKISSLTREIKEGAGAALAVFTTVVALAGCQPYVRTATFPLRPDTAEAGSLLGPFDGQVLDADTSKPIAGALVFASWGFEVGRGLVAPAGSWSRTVETASDGSYVVPPMGVTPGNRARVVRFTLVIYRRGYVAYRSDRRFDDLSARHDFAQHLNIVKLERFTGTMSHVKHVLFAGGGAELKRAMEREYVEASFELGQPPRATEAPRGPLLDASVLLSLDELKAVTGATINFSVERLGDLPQTTTYDSRHFRAVGKAESFDAAIRVWKLPTPEAADARYASLLREVPNVEERNEMGDRSLRGSDARTGQPAKILAAAVEDRDRGVVIELTCGVDLCRDADQASALLKRLLARDDKLGRPAESHDQSDADEKKPEEDEQFKLKTPELHR